MNPKILFALFTLLIFGKYALANESVSLLEEFRLETVASQLGLATGFAFAADDRIFVTTKEGLVHVVQAGVVHSEPFIDLRDAVNDSGDRGLTDVAVHPDFPNTPYIYLVYVLDPQELSGMSGLAAPDARGRRVSRLTRFTADVKQNYNRVLPGSELIIVGKNSRFDTMGTASLNRNQGDIACMQGDAFIEDCLPSDDYSHVVGSVLFAKDGSMYLGYGDGSTVAPLPLPMTLRTLDLGSMAGKLLRVNPDTGQGYADNPFYDGDLDSNRSKVINYGLRNPYGFTIDPVSDKVFMADTGWTTWEELDEGRGKNFGWPCYEGGDGRNSPQPLYADLCANYLATPRDITPPLYAYEHGNKGGAVTGIEIYQGNTYPIEYKGALFYNDFIRSEVSVITLKDGKFQAVNTFATQWPGISKIRRSADENIYFLDLINGTLSRLVYGADPSQLPLAVIEADRFYGELPLQIKFSASSSSDPLGGTLSYKWTFADGGFSDLETPEHVYQKEGVYQVELEATSTAGLTNSDFLTVFAGKIPPNIEFLDPLQDERYASGTEVRFEASVEPNDTNFDYSQAKFEWSAYTTGGAISVVSLKMENFLKGSFDYPELKKDGYVSLCLLVTTADGLEGENCLVLKPLLANVSLFSDPSGLSLTLNGDEVTTPHATQLHVGVSATVSVSKNKGYEFDSWSNNESETHTITVPEAGVVITGTFRKTKGLGSLGIWFLLISIGCLKLRAKSYC